MSEQKVIQVNGLYRHFKGGYYLIDKLAKLEKDPESVMVVYTSVVTGQTCIRPYDEFFDDVTEREDNTTHQVYRFEPAHELKGLLTLTPTKELVDELKTRGDNPYEGFKSLEEDEDVWSVQFIIGHVAEKKDDKGDIYEEFLPLTPAAFDSLESAKRYRERFYPNRPAIIARRVTKKVIEF